MLINWNSVASLAWRAWRLVLFHFVWASNGRERGPLVGKLAACGRLSETG